MIRFETILFIFLIVSSATSIPMHNNTHPKALEKYTQLVLGTTYLYEFIKPKTAYEASQIVTELTKQKNLAPLVDNESYRTAITYFTQRRDDCINKEYPGISRFLQYKANEASKAVALILHPTGFSFEYVQ